ncbi:MAG TPA: HAMP domain-containing sensor histidine kinase [Tepidisphaeraceae bacterium]|nr:HAMP domain-containing sensor histidine kinase [Tepidisphaeraceae bacterium]
MNSPAMDLLSGRAFPELAEAVRGAADEAVAAWEQVVRGSITAAKKLTIDQLRDDLPKILISVAAALESDKPYATVQLDEAAPRHGSVRYDQGFNLSEVLIEYGIFRSVLIEHVALHLRRSIEAIEIMAICSALDIALRRAVVRFVEHLTSQLQTATEAQSKYLSFLSHDLRGGLNAVFLMIEVLKRELASEPRLSETVGDLDAMRRSLMETVSTMDRFLHAERFRKGMVQVRPGKVTLRTLLAETAAHFSYQAKEKRVEVRLDVPEDFEIISDRDLLNQIFQNLASNALKYTKPATAVTIACRGGQGKCIVTFSDQGPGIAPEKLEEVFVAFTRGETHGQGGVGLGLSIARQAGECIGAKIWAESKPGEGAMFVVDVPREITGKQQTAESKAQPPRA